MFSISNIHYMRLLIPQTELNQLRRLVVLPVETGFMIRAKRTEDALIYVDTPIIMKGQEHEMHLYELVQTPDGKTQLYNQSKEQGLAIIVGHTHPYSNEVTINPYLCGWTAPRTEEFRDYRNQKLQKTEAGRKALDQRKRILDAIVDEDNVEAKQNLAASLIHLSHPTSAANLIEINGVPFYITNKINFLNTAEILADISPCTGDLPQNFILQRSGVDYSALIYALPEHVFSQPAAEKFGLSVIEYAAKDQVTPLLDNMTSNARNLQIEII
jgi:hypothetical protein